MARALTVTVALLTLSLAGCRRRPAALELDEGDVFPGKPVVHLCRKGWTHEQCCTFLQRCLGTVCADSPRAVPGAATVASWCPTLSDKDVRCHVFHCYVSISPTGGIKDHDSHCRHAAHQLPGGACPALVYE
jgi:hypothetical protein